MIIKILTFHSENNYGANLQAFALSNYIKSLGHSVEFLDYKREGVEDNIRFKIIRKWLGKGIFATLKKIRNNLISIKREKIFKIFQNSNFTLSKHSYSSIADLRKYAPDADIYIVGSDQVWSRSIISLNDLHAYLLNFGPSSVIKISYAASSGGEEFSNRELIEARKLLNKFDFVGVRERSLKVYLDSCLNLKTYFVPDPTFLIDWQKIVPFTRLKNKNIGMFILKESNKESFLIHFSKALNFSKEFDDLVDFSNKFLSPFDWIREISDYKIVSTDSYHAILFCVYTNTPFVFLKWGNGYFRDQRVLDILKELDLEEFAINPEQLNDLSMERFLSIDWNRVNAVVNNLKSVGVDFLDSVFRLKYNN